MINPKLPANTLKRQSENPRFGFVLASGIVFYTKAIAVEVAKRMFISHPIYQGEDLELFPKGSLGTPIMSDITFGDGDFGTYFDINGNEITYEGLVIELVLLTVNQRKNIVKTQIQGLKGTIKEYISDDDYTIELKGIISDVNNAYPESLIQRIINICEIPSEIPVKSSYLNLFGIYNVVIESYNFPQSEGFRNQQEFTISMTSDSPIDLQNIESSENGQNNLTSE